jgi:hypothetical protein
MGMMGHGRAPGVQHQGGADVRAEMSGVGCDAVQRLGRDLEQQTKDHRLVVSGQFADRRRQGEHHMIVLDRQQVGLAGLQPASGCTALALRAVAVAAGVIGDPGVVARWAAQHMIAQRRAAALFVGRHDLELAAAEVGGLRTTPGRPASATVLCCSRGVSRDRITCPIAGLR